MESVLIPVVPDVLDVVVVLQHVDELFHVLDEKIRKNQDNFKLFDLFIDLPCIAQFLMYVAIHLTRFMITDCTPKRKSESRTARATLFNLTVISLCFSVDRPYIGIKRR